MNSVGPTAIMAMCALLSTLFVHLGLRQYGVDGTAAAFLSLALLWGFGVVYLATAIQIHFHHGGLR